MTSAYLSSPVPVALAHRGGWLLDDQGVRRTELENTAAAFQHAVDLGYTYLETDVHATSDGVLMAFHDPTLDRATDMSGAIGDLPHREVARARVAGREPVPVLEDLLGTWPEARFNIDVKADAAVLPLREALRRTNAWDRVCVGSFDQRRLDRARRLLDRPVATSCGPLDVVRLRAASLSPLLRSLASRVPVCAQIPLRHGAIPLLSRDLIATAHRLGMQVHVWTINEPGTMERLLDAGVDGIVTDNTSALRELLVRRGQWPGRTPSGSTDAPTGTSSDSPTDSPTDSPQRNG
ncbi:glycerophosphodiester phosphodiesterase [Nocardiopsis dassonvillei]|uniref:glycerophosphodiester phosphodiesterase family protein n=1 Tax=Nocardiopsis dassonvillei TaxID=2014 RepID=UPI0020A2618D|nr:glycerophosphodiester phosphodiesterase family protein [Nocardiopsis dassonvillei]MCP3012634.1 glycerophosphodiester phosphodiesterase [Nocardiopsis dassonvillei]